MYIAYQTVLILEKKIIYQIGHTPDIANFKEKYCTEKCKEFKQLISITKNTTSFMYNF